MSSDETQSALSRAYQLVEAGNYDEARAILDPILAANKNNADAWWIYAHAITEPDGGRDALEQVVRINPQYPGAAELLAQARTRFPAKPKITSLVRPVSVPAAPEHLPEVPAEPAHATQEQPAVRQARRSLLPLIAVLAVVVIIAAVAIFLLTQNSLTTPGTTATSQVVALATETPLAVANTTIEASTATETAVPTEALTEIPTVVTEATSEATDGATSAAATDVAPTQVATEASSETLSAPATAENAADIFADIELALAAFPIAESGVGEVQTSLGSTLMVSACTTPGRAMRTLLPQVMNALALKSAGLGTAVDAIGVRLLDCSANTPLLTVAVDLATAQSFAGGTLTSAEFATTWQPQS